MSSCNFRCKFCQNPDTWTLRGSKKISITEAKERLLTLLPYLKTLEGGVTVSGGEPCMQAKFVTELFKLAHSLKLSTALDTNGTCRKEVVKALLTVTDNVLLDIKASSPILHKELTGKPLKPVLEFGRLADKLSKRMVIRRVLLPGINDSLEELQLLSDYIHSLSQKPSVELIPYHKLGVHKWKELGLKYTLDKLRPPSESKYQQVSDYLKGMNLTVFRG
jgi:pyruvate formate lyase activating enzyme